MELPKKEYVELRCYYTWVGDDGIVRTKVKNGAEIELEDAIENSRVVNGFQIAEKFPIIVDTGQIKSMSKEARDFFSLRNRESKVNSIAIIRNKVIGNMIANFFIGLNKPAVPVKLFSREQEAVEWCKQFKKSVHVSG
ncbi:MAG: hypothetical protein HUJ25_16810 [Crocinitomicaceae bacterium]|nr:hypothetical protein [Crocinitomicaceae bacterium]